MPNALGAATKAPRKAGALVPALLLLLASASFAAEKGAKAPVDPRPDYIPFDDPKLVELLAKIDAAGAYAAPDLSLRKDENYAGTSEDREPFAGTRPFKENFLTQVQYYGPGRDKPEPEHLDTVKVGFIGPIMSTVSVATGGKSHEESLGIPMLQGARLAVEEWNARGGYLKRSIPFELVISNDNGLWGSSGNEIIKQAYKDEVWGILGTIDGANSHIAIRVALKAEVVMINPADTDPTFIETNIPWVIRVIGDDRQQAYLLTDYWYRKLDLKKVAIIRSSNRYGRFGVREVVDSARRLGRPVPIEMAYRVGQKDFQLELGRIKRVNPDAVVHWGDAVEGALILNQMREIGMRQPFFGCDRTVSDEFVKIAGKNAEGVVAAFPWNPQAKDPRLERFKKAYRERYGQEAETYAAHAYDGMNLMLWAINAAGLNRAKIRDVIAFLPHPWPGVTGDIVFSACLDDVSDTYIATYENGAWRYVSRSELGIPKGYVAPRDRLNRDAEIAAAGLKTTAAKK
ncbi:MAG TPA: ABC transporter substrate-binding protein [Vicinamibacteria bacterium]|nr:ABC transporter substrate-binding protein [Vicinamibacteria bacterium]